MKVGGLRTVIPFHRDMVTHPAFAGDRLEVFTNWVDTEYTPQLAGAGTDIEHVYTEREQIVIEIDGRLHRVGIPTNVLGRAAAPAAEPTEGDEGGQVDAPAEEGAVVSPFAGSLVAWQVEDGAEVTEGQAVASVEAMKMESAVKAPASGTLSIAVQPGEKISKGTVLGTIS